MERGAAEALQDIAPAAVRGHEIGQVDMSLAVAFAGQGTALKGESAEYRFHHSLLSKRPGLSQQTSSKTDAIPFPLSKHDGTPI